MNTQTLERIVDNWINGNRTEAKQQAKRVGYSTLLDHFTQYRDWSRTNAHEVVSYLKGADNWQEACDATADECHTGR